MPLPPHATNPQPPGHGAAGGSAPSSLPALRVIEPNLAGHSGHYAEFVSAVAARAEGALSRVDVWASQRATGLFANQPRVTMVGAFTDGGTRKQEVEALRQALHSGDPFLVLTARAVHAPMLQWLARRMRGSSGGSSGSGGSGTEALRRARLYFHWKETGALKRAMVACAPTVRANAVAIAPTQSTADFLRATGWQRVALVPYPMLPPAEVPPPQPFQHLLMAGAARMNKGLDLVAGLAERMAKRGDPTLLLVQTTPKRTSGRRGSAEEVQVERLHASGALGLRASDQALDTAGYGQRFRGALVLAPYDPVHFADSVSGVVLDALLRGAPVVASAGSWPGRVVERFGAGAVFAPHTAEALDQAVQQVLREWPRASAHAQQAARELAAEHDPAHLVRVLAGGV